VSRDVGREASSSHTTLAFETLPSSPKQRSGRRRWSSLRVTSAGWGIRAEKTLRDAVVTVDADAVVEDVSDGWAGFALDGSGVREAFARLSELCLPQRGFVQGEVARLPVKAIAEPERLLLLVPAMFADHLERRIREDCAEVLR
jgi:hypothetical protein